MQHLNTPFFLNIPFFQTPFFQTLYVWDVYVYRMQCVLCQCYFSRKQPYLPPNYCPVSGISMQSQRRKFDPLLFYDQRPRKWCRGFLERVFVKLSFNTLVLKKYSVSPLTERGKPWSITSFHIFSGTLRIVS